MFILKKVVRNNVLEKIFKKTLTAWLTLNQIDPGARKYLCTQIAEHYVYDQSKKIDSKTKV